MELYPRESLRAVPPFVQYLLFILFNYSSNQSHFTVEPPNGFYIPREHDANFNDQNWLRRRLTTPS